MRGVAFLTGSTKNVVIPYATSLAASQGFHYDTGSNNHQFSFTVTSETYSGGQAWGVFEVRRPNNSADQGYRYQKGVNSGTSDYFIRENAGQSVLGSASYQGLANYIVRMQGSTFTVFRNGVVLYSVVDGTFPNGTWVLLSTSLGQSVSNIAINTI